MKEFEPKEFFKVLKRETISALIIASGVALIGFVWFTLEQYMVRNLLFRNVSFEAANPVASAVKVVEEEPKVPQAAPLASTLSESSLDWIMTLLASPLFEVRVNNGIVM